MVKPEGSITPLGDAERVDAAWSPMKLVLIGLVTLVVALSVIITLGSRIGGCGYLDGAHGAYDIDKRK